jgi:hypothetical protein
MNLMTIFRRPYRASRSSQQRHRHRYVHLLVEGLESRELLSTKTGSLSFTNTPLVTDQGNSEPEIAVGKIGSTDTVGVAALDWLSFASNLWTGPFGSTPSGPTPIDTALHQPGKTVLGGGDVDLDIGSTGTIHATSILFMVNPTSKKAQIGVSAITIMNGAETAQIIDTAGADRPWITSDGPHVWIAYHDAGNSALIHVQRSDDDGLTWHRVADPIVGQGGATANATFNNEEGPIVADPSSSSPGHEVLYDIYAAGETGFLKSHTFTPNNIYVARSTNGGQSWTTTLVYSAPPGTALDSIFPSLAVDPTSGKLYATWSDGQHVGFATSSDHGAHWTTQTLSVNLAPASTAIFPWVAAYSGKVDVVYYGTNAASDSDPTAVWNVYLAQSIDDGADFTQSLVSHTSNHVGVISTAGTASPPGTRNLLDLFQVAIDPQSGHAAVVYTDDTLTKDSSGNPLPQVVLAYEDPPGPAPAGAVFSPSVSGASGPGTTSSSLAPSDSGFQPLAPGVTGAADPQDSSLAGPLLSPSNTKKRP